MPGSAPFDQVVEVLKAGRPAIFPTDTVVGLGVSVRDCPGPDVLFELKGRPSGKPVAWLVEGAEALREYGRGVPQAAFDLAAERWPGPLTLVVRASERVPEPYRSPAGTIGLRMPAGAAARKLIREVGCPLATTSANLSGEKAPRSMESVSLLLRERAIFLTSAEQGSGTASQVIDFTTNPPTTLR